MMKKLILFLIANIVHMVVLQLRAYSITWAIVGEGLAFFFLTLWALSYFKDSIKTWHIPIIILLGKFWIEVPIRLIQPKETFLTTLLVTNTLLAIILAYLYHRGYFKSFIIGIWAWLLLSTTGQQFFAEYASHGNAVLHVNIGQELIVSTDNKELSFSELPAEYVLLDFWSSSCGVCFQEFPIVQELADTYNKEGSRIQVVSIFTCTRDGEDVGFGSDLLKERGWSFPVYAIQKDSPVFKICNFNAFPRVILLDANREIIYNGSLAYAERKIQNIMRGHP